MYKYRETWKPFQKYHSSSALPTPLYIHKWLSNTVSHSYTYIIQVLLIYVNVCFAAYNLINPTNVYAEMKTEATYVTAPPPMGYPVMMKEDSPETVQPNQSQSKGSGGFLRGWYFFIIFFNPIPYHNVICMYQVSVSFAFGRLRIVLLSLCSLAAMCCCCVLDCVF